MHFLSRAASHLVEEALESQGRNVIESLVNKVIPETTLTRPALVTEGNRDPFMKHLVGFQFISA